MLNFIFASISRKEGKTVFSEKGEGVGSFSTLKFTFFMVFRRDKSIKVLKMLHVSSIYNRDTFQYLGQPQN